MLGETGKFPEGKLNKHDEGELKIAIGQENGNVSIHFGKQIMWLAMPPDQAISFANCILVKANLIKNTQ